MSAEYRHARRIQQKGNIFYLMFSFQKLRHTKKITLIEAISHLTEPKTHSWFLDGLKIVKGSMTTWQAPQTCSPMKLVKIIKKQKQPFKVSGNGPKETQQMEFTQENLLKFGNNSKSGISTETYSVLLPLKSVRWKLCSRLVQIEKRVSLSRSSQSKGYLPRRSRMLALFILPLATCWWG